MARRCRWKNGSQRTLTAGFLNVRTRSWKYFEKYRRPESILWRRIWC